jgi:hypothetical protein
LATCGRLLIGLLVGRRILAAAGFQPALVHVSTASRSFRRGSVLAMLFANAGLDSIRSAFTAETDRRTGGESRPVA